MQSVPFTVGESVQEALQVRGRVSIGSVSLTLELEPPPAEPRDETRKVVIGLEEFAGCKFRRGLLSDRLDLQTLSLAAFGGVPGAFQDGMTLRFSKRDRSDAEALAARLSHRVVRA